MLDWIAAFITGLTAGGVSCLAVQGGLLASAVAPPTAASVLAGRSKAQGQPIAAQPLTARPILLFLGAKLAAYTVLGLLLGALGSMLQLTPLTRALLLMAIGVFMVGNGLRMLNVHPIFRYFTFEPPAVVRRYLRRTARSGAAAVTPLFLGALTVLIPCGVTQAMMALAMGTGDALQAAGLMAAFTLGSNLIFFVVAYLATRLSMGLEKYAVAAAAVLMLVLGVLSVDSGLALMGAPFSFSRMAQAAQSPVPVIQPTVQGTVAAEEIGLAGGENRVQIAALNNGYEPALTYARADVPTRLTFVTRDVHSCSRALVIPELGVEQILAATGEFSVDVPPQPAGKVLYYSCSMGMYTGQIVFNE